MRAGKLRHKIYFYKKENVRDDYSGYSEEYVYDSSVRADVKYMGGKSQIVNDQLFPAADIVFTIRYKKSIDGTTRIKFKDQIYEIQDISIMEPNAGMIITCSKLLEM